MKKTFPKQEVCEQLIVVGDLFLRGRKTQKEECLQYERRNREKTRYEAEEQIKKEENAGLTLEEAKQQAQVLIRYVAINQSEVIFFSVIIDV